MERKSGLNTPPAHSQPQDQYNLHVNWLTIGSGVFERGIRRDLSRDNQHANQFILRKMWAKTLLEQMRNLGWDWPMIRDMTGKTRQTWQNVTDSGFVDLETVLAKPSEERAKKFRENNYRPITNSFIRRVTETLEHTHRFRITTNAFRYAFDCGMTVFQSDFFSTLSEDLTVARLGIDGPSFLQESIEDADELRTAVTRADTGDIEIVSGVFPLLCLNPNEVGQADVLEYVKRVELLVYGYASKKSKRPNERAVLALEAWQKDQGHEQFRPDETEFESETWFDPMAGMKRSVHKAPKRVPISNQWVETRGMKTNILKADDGKPATADLGGFYVQLPKTEVLPQMINAEGQAAFHVIVQFNEKNEPIGTVVMHNPKGGFSVKGV